MNKVQLQSNAAAKVTETRQTGNSSRAATQVFSAQSAKVDKRQVDKKLVSLLSPNSVEAGHYHRLRLAVENIKPGKGAVVVAVTSPAAGDGKSLTSLNLAGALAQNPQHRVLLVELDLRQPNRSLTKYLGLTPVLKNGLVASLVNGELDWKKTVYQIAEFNLDILACEKQVTAPYEALRSARLASFFTDARDFYDYIVVDTAPALLVPDCQLIEKYIDQYIVVVAAGNTGREMLGECLNLMGPGQVLGLVFNSTLVSKDYEYGY